VLAWFDVVALDTQFLAQELGSRGGKYYVLQLIPQKEIFRGLGGGGTPPPHAERRKATKRRKTNLLFHLSNNQMTKQQYDYNDQPTSRGSIL
jgi:hypothetical protein